jgi:hypothetical protein
VDVHLRRNRTQPPETRVKVHIHPRMAAIYPLKKNYVARFPTIRFSRHVAHYLDPFAIKPGNGNLRSEHAIPAQSGQPRHLRS